MGLVGGPTQREFKPSGRDGSCMVKTAQLAWTWRAGKPGDHRLQASTVPEIAAVNFDVCKAVREEPATRRSELITVSVQKQAYRDHMRG